MHRLTKEQARRVAVRAQLLDATRPADVVSMVEHLTLIQIDPTAAVAPTADLVAWSRLGSSYRPDDLKRAIEHDRTLAHEFGGRTALLSPFDRLIHDRVRAMELFAFEYVVEMYKPVASRRWGFYALPILHGDRLVGKLDARSDREASVLRVNAIHEDVPFTRAVRRAVDAEIADLASWLGLAQVESLHQ